MKTDKTHWCGCVTRKKKGVISFVSCCDLHKFGGKREYKKIWLIFQH